MKPPKCRLCGREEWNHVCSGVRATSMFDDGTKTPATRIEPKTKGRFESSPAPRPLKAPAPKPAAPRPARTVVPKAPIAEPAPKPLKKPKDRRKRDRSPYQAQMMRDVRAAEKLGMTTTEYRAMKAKEAEK